MSQRELGVLILDLGIIGHNLTVTGEDDLAVLAADGGADVVLHTVFGATGLLDCLFHGNQHFLAVDIFLTGNGISHLQQFETGCSRHLQSVLLLSKTLSFDHW